MPSDTGPQRAIQLLTELDTPRVWSLLVSIFGDLAQAPQDRIDGPLLTRITQEMGIKPEAVRVALHRLRNDNWITSVKSGRTASHALTPFGRTQSQAVSPLIYSKLEDLPQDWQIAILPKAGEKPKDTSDLDRFVQLLPRVLIGDAQAKPQADALVVKGDSLPSWAKDALNDDAALRQFEHLAETLQRVDSNLQSLKEMSVLETAVLRCLIVHHWRRLVLRHPYLPPSALGHAWPAHTCRNKVTHLLDRLSRPSLVDLLA